MIYFEDYHAPGPSVSANPAGMEIWPLRGAILFA